MTAPSALEKVRREITAHPMNADLTAKGWTPVYSAHPDAKILIIGQAPGRLAQESGVPWDDPSGKNLRAWLGVSDAIFYDETIVSLLPMDFYFPGSLVRGDAPPRPDFAPLWHHKILTKMPNIGLTVLIGQYAQKYYLPDQERNLTETVRNFRNYLPKFLPIVHPSPRNNIWQKKNPWFARDVIPALQNEVKQALA